MYIALIMCLSLFSELNTHQQQSNEMDAIAVHTLQVRKQRHNETEQFIHHHTTRNSTQGICLLI